MFAHKPNLKRGLAFGHFVWGFGFALVAAYIAYSAFAVLPHMSTGNVLSQLGAAMFVAGQYSLPFVVLGGWILILGRRIWRGARRVRIQLLVTHIILLVVGSLSIVVGVYAIREAQASIARGGGLLSPIAWVPMIFGLALVILAFPSLIITLTAVPKTVKS